MKAAYNHRTALNWIGLLLLLVGASPTSAQTLVTPMMGGSQTSGTMAHIDIWYDEVANQLHANVDNSVGVPELRALDNGYAFDPQAAYATLNGKAYNAQYGWNPGGYFTIPSGAAIWVAVSNASPELEAYEGAGKFGSYTPILGTHGSSPRWKWSGSMVHNTYAVRDPESGIYRADYQVYFGHALTGSREGFEQYDDAVVHLEWTTVPNNRSTLEFGATGLTNGAPLVFVNADSRGNRSGFVVNLQDTRPGPEGTEYVGEFSMLALPASAANGGPSTHHASPGSCVEWEPVSLAGPQAGKLRISFTNTVGASLSMRVGDNGNTNRICVTSTSGSPGSDPFGRLAGRSLSASMPGLYRLGFRLVDSSTNGVGGGPIHAASEVYYLNIQAGTTVAEVKPCAGGITVRFSGQIGRAFYLEHTTNFLDATWETIAGPLRGTNCLQEFVTTMEAHQGWFRLVSTPQ